VKDDLERGELVRLAYRLGRAQATGVLTIDVPRSRPEVLILRRGHLITAENDVSGRVAAARLARLAALDGTSWSFDGGTAAYPPGATGRQVSLAAWARAHLESQVDSARAERLQIELAGVRLAIRPELAPDPVDDTDRRILAAMSQPRRLDQIWPLARTPRFRLVGFLHFLRSVGALSVVGVGAADAAPPRMARGTTPPDPRTAAMRLLGLDGADLSRESVKRAYRRMARALHPDLHPGVTESRRRELEARFAEVTAAYQSLC
jgi:hypothetical protein